MAISYRIHKKEITPNSLNWSLEGSEALLEVTLTTVPVLNDNASIVSQYISNCEVEN